MNSTAEARPLTRDEARERASMVAVESYEVEFDLTTSESMFSVMARVRFTSLVEGASTFIEHRPHQLLAAEFNGETVEVERALVAGRIRLAPLRANNELLLRSMGQFSTSAEGLCRYVDPEDSEVYVFSHCFLDLAPRLFPCFDQPDLKAAFEFRARLPLGWSARSNGIARQMAPGRWAFERTPPIPTYVTSFIAGPWHVVESEHEGIPLALVCRRSMARFLDVAALFDEVRTALDRFCELFGAYPFTKLDLVFAPNWIGGMENAALILLGEDSLFRSRVTEEQRRTRSELIFHEIAHMWFGDCVTTQWWDDLWLNEAFATFVADRARQDVPTVWPMFALGKDGGYREDQAPTTHPISSGVRDTADALLNFDEISYVKGATVLRQLVEWVGDSSLEVGMRRFIEAHRFANASIDDFLAALGHASGRELDGWAASWLRSSGVVTLSSHVAVGDEGRYRSVVVEQAAFDGSPAYLPHRFTLATLERHGEVLQVDRSVAVEMEGPRVEITELVGEPAGVVILPDASDLTWAKQRLDHDSLDALLDAGVWRIEDPTVRARAWMTVRDLALDAELPVQIYLEALEAGVEREAGAGIAAVLLDHAVNAIRRLGRATCMEVRSTGLAQLCGNLVDRSSPGSDHRLVFARGMIECAWQSSQLDRLGAWLMGVDLPPGLMLGPPERWSIIRRLITMGSAGQELIDQERSRDDSTFAREHAALACAAIPTLEAKEKAWRSMFEATAEAYTLRLIISTGFRAEEHASLMPPFLDRLLPALERAWREESPFGTSLLTRELLMGVPIEAEWMSFFDEAVARSDLHPSLHRLLVEQRWEFGRLLETRRRDDCSVAAGLELKA